MLGVTIADILFWRAILNNIYYIITLKISGKKYYYTGLKII